MNTNNYIYAHHTQRIEDKLLDMLLPCPSVHHLCDVARHHIQVVGVEKALAEIILYWKVWDPPGNGMSRE